MNGIAVVEALWRRKFAILDIGASSEEMSYIPNHQL